MVTSKRFRKIATLPHRQPSHRRGRLRQCGSVNRTDTRTAGGKGMTTQDDGFNLLTRVGPGTPMGNLFRRFWLPALLANEPPEPDGTPVRIRILCEDLLAFRDTEGRVGIVGAYCPHKRAPLFFGRNE